jgi:hypothetical protein
VMSDCRVIFEEVISAISAVCCSRQLESIGKRGEYRYFSFGLIMLLYQNLEFLF